LKLLNYCMNIKDKLAKLLNLDFWNLEIVRIKDILHSNSYSVN